MIVPSPVSRGDCGRNVILRSFDTLRINAAEGSRFGRLAGIVGCFALLRITLRRFLSVATQSPDREG